MKQKQLLSFLVCILMLSSCAAPTDSALDSGLTLRVYFADAEEIRLLPLEDYVFGALAAEMPANYAPEALKCQAVAARTRAVAQSRAFGGNGCVRHPDCDICTDSACCQAYQTDAQLQARWGSEYVVLRARIDRAVRATDGLLLTSGGLPIEVLYHACSGGKTEDAAAVFASAKPYLVSVDSPGEEGYAGFRADTSFSCEEAADLLLRAFPGCGVTADTLPSAIRLQSTTASGRVATLLVGSQTVRGAESALLAKHLLHMGGGWRPHRFPHRRIRARRRLVAGRRTGDGGGRRGFRGDFGALLPRHAADTDG